MPELPEVEMVVRHLRRLLEGRRIERARLLRARLAPDLTPRQFAARLRGAEIAEVGRRGKHILVQVGGGWTWVIHLRMSGRFLLAEKEMELPPFTHATFELDNGWHLLFTDQRHFGLMMVVRTAELEGVEALRRLGPEPFDDGFSVEYLSARCERSRQPIKLLLLDQSKVVGLGNIYAAEALHRAGIDPRLEARQLSPRRLTRLHAEIREVLREAIEAGSTLNTDPREVYGRYGSGAFEENWRVYDREGDPCPGCGEAVQRFTQGGRSTYYCAVCQQ
ncbi:MAG: bifunctional DNA-formamidopyrimidine glycosylase/DNA-(apurinic or apyrimidinic site) lyase [Blastocatellia bacterium]